MHRKKKRTCERCGCWKLPHNACETAESSATQKEMNINVARKKPKWKKLINDEQKTERRKNTNWWREAYKTWCPQPAPPLAHRCLHPLSAPCRLSNLINRMRKRTIATHHRKRSTIFKQTYGPTLHQARWCAVQIRKRFLYSSGKWPQSSFATSTRWKKHS